MSTVVACINGLGLAKIVLLVLVLYITHVIIHAFVTSPVRHVPGPWWARVSRLPLLYATFHRRRTAYASALLARYGRVVVIAPDQIHTTDEDAMKVIYDRHARKTAFYAGMGSWKGVKSTLGFIDYASAAPTRNNLLACFQNKNLVTLTANLSAHIDAFCALLRARAGRDLDGVVIFRLLALDIVTDVLWGERQTLLARTVGVGVGDDPGHDDDGDAATPTPDFLRRFHAFSAYNALKSFIPGLDLGVRCFGTPRWRRLRQDCRDLDITAREALRRWEEDVGKGGSADGPGRRRRDRDVLSMLRSMDADGRGAGDARARVPGSHITAYVVEMLAAGSSTTSHTATFTCWELTRHPDAARKLRAELAIAFPDRREIDHRKMMGLPYLNAVICETMRMIPMIPGPLERHIGEDIEIDGLRVGWPPRHSCFELTHCKIPRGVIASTSAYDQGRVPSVFPSPDEWIPERWLDANERMHLNWIPFGYGSRSCPGSNLAMTELKYIIGTTFRHFRVELPKDHIQDRLDIADVFVAGERSGHCWLRFVED